MKALALDFDGVVSDSAREAFQVALRAYAELRGDSPLAQRARRPDPGLPEYAELYRGFLELMPLGNRAEDFGVALAALDAGAVLPDQAAYDAFREGRGTAFLEQFHTRFYAVRRAWQERDPAGWRGLLKPYDPFLAVLRRRAGEVILAIVTAKDARSVHVLLQDYGVSDLFSPERILDKETGVRKSAHLSRLVRELELTPEEITFVDDKVNHLEEVSRLGVRCALAGWGYNGERERRLARRAGFRVLSLAGAEQQLFG